VVLAARILAGQRVGPNGSRVDPVAQPFHLGGGQPLAFGRHDLFVVAAGDAAE